MYDFVILDISFLLFMLIMSNNCICKSMLHNYCTSKWLKVPHPNMIRMTSGCLRFTHIYTLIDIYLILIRQHIENVRHISSSRVLQLPRKFVSFPFCDGRCSLMTINYFFSNEIATFCFFDQNLNSEILLLIQIIINH